MSEHVENVENSEDVENFKMSATWFVGFFKKSKILLRRKTYDSQKNS